MATAVRHDRIVPLRKLCAYPEQPWMDMVLYLPKADGQGWGPAVAGRRRLWVLAPQGQPTAVRVNDRTATLVTPDASGWHDFGVAEIDTGFAILRVAGLTAAQAREAYLVIAQDASFDPRGKSLADAERALWGLAREEAGSTSLTPNTAQAGLPASFTVVYTAGPAGLPAGACVRLAVAKLFSRPQADNPDAPGYVRIASSDAPIVIDRVENSIESHEKIDVIVRLAAPFAPGQRFTLSYRTETMYLFPVVLANVDRMYWYTNMPPLAAAVAVRDGAPFVSLAEGNSHAFMTVPGPAEELHLTLPGRRRAGERLVLRGVFADRFRNVPPAGPIDLVIRLALEGPAGGHDLGSPAGRMEARHRFAIDLGDLAPGVYRAVARRADDGAVVARSNPLEVMPAGDPRDGVYWGEIHTHTEMSDGSGAYEFLYRHSRQDGCQDFAAAADHACYHSDNQWLWMQDATNAANDPPHFITLIGYEWAGSQCHRNVYTSADRLDLFRGMYQPTSNLDAVYGHFHGRHDVVAGPHGLLAHGVIWKHHDPDVERFAEIYSMWGAGDDPDGPLASSWTKANEHAMPINEILATGAKLGFTGGGDCHEARGSFSCRFPQQGVRGHTFAPLLQFHSGITAALLATPDRKALLGSLRNRRTYATTGPRMLLDFSVGGLPMGAEGACRNALVRAAVHAVGAIAKVEIIKDGKLVHSQTGQGLDADVQWTDPAPGTGEPYYYLRVTQGDGEVGWTSPVWVRAS